MVHCHRCCSESLVILSKWFGFNPRLMSLTSVRRLVTEPRAVATGCEHSSCCTLLLPFAY
jgi:hypothetical protein